MVKHAEFHLEIIELRTWMDVPSEYYEVTPGYYTIQHQRAEDDMFLVWKQRRSRYNILR
jgi:hypothetical protein